MKRVEFIEIDIDYCSLSYGVGACPASGAEKCFNTKATCQAKAAYSTETVTLRFAAGSSYLAESGIDIVAPCIESVNYSPGEISLGENLGKRSSLSVSFSDFPFADTGKGLDKYADERHYDPFEVGTFWGKFRARHPYLRGRNLRWIQGDSTQSIDQMEVRHFIIDNFDGPSLNGRFSITAKDVLKLADDDRVKVPVASRGFLLGDITAGQTSFTIGPAGMGNIEYPASGVINIAGKEICHFTRSGDLFTVNRGQEGTLPSDHKAQDRVQVCKVFEGVDPADAIRDLLVNYASIPASYVPIEDWLAETQSFLRRRYSRIIAEPMGVSKAISELIQQAGLMVWWDEVAKLIRLKVMRAIDTDALAYDEMNVLKGTFRQKDMPSSRVSQVLSYFGQRTPLDRAQDATSYHSLQLNVNLEAESNYGDSIVRTLHCSWIPQFGRPIADRLNQIILGRFVDPPREFQFSTLRSEQVIQPIAGDGYRLYSRPVQNAFGRPQGIPVQITKVSPKPEGYDVTAVEMNFVDFSEEDLTDRTIIIDGNTYNFNWRTAYNRLYPDPTPDDDIVCYVSEGAIVGSQILGRPAFEVGNWPAGINLRLIVYGRIQGRGGNGGMGDPNSWTHGEAGSAALLTRYPLRIESNNQIWGGGGGGGSGTWKYGGGGGGGQGFTAGMGGTPVTNSDPLGPRAGTSGTTERAGKGATWKGSDGGDGGAAGQKGQDSTGNSVSKGGAAGPAIDGNSFVTFTGPQGSILGPRIN